MTECRCDERLRVKPEGSTRLTYTGLCGGLEHLKIETNLFRGVCGGTCLFSSEYKRRNPREGDVTLTSQNYNEIEGCLFTSE
jgi:hypothetical protein